MVFGWQQEYSVAILLHKLQQVLQHSFSFLVVILALIIILIIVLIIISIKIMDFRHPKFTLFVVVVLIFHTFYDVQIFPIWQKTLCNIYMPQSSFC
jgi:hypothetical protein